MIEYYLCEFEYGYEGQFYQVVENGNLIGYVDMNNQQIILEGEYGCHMIGNEPVTPIWVNNI